MKIMMTVLKWKRICKRIAKMIIACGAVLLPQRRKKKKRTRRHCLKQPLITHVNRKSISPTRRSSSIFRPVNRSLSSRHLLHTQPRMDERKFKQSEPLSPHIHLIPLSPEHAEGQAPEPCEWDFRSSSCRYLLLSPVIDLLNWFRIYRVVTQVPVPLNCNRVASCTALVSLRCVGERGIITRNIINIVESSSGLGPGRRLGEEAEQFP